MGGTLQYSQRQIEDMGGKIVQPDEKSVIFSMWVEYDPMYPTWTSNELKNLHFHVLFCKISSETSHTETRQETTYPQN